MLSVSLYREIFIGVAFDYQRLLYLLAIKRSRYDPSFPTTKLPAVLFLFSIRKSGGGGGGEGKFFQGKYQGNLGFDLDFDLLSYLYPERKQERSRRIAFNFEIGGMRIKILFLN